MSREELCNILSKKHILVFEYELKLAKEFLDTLKSKKIVHLLYIDEQSINLDTMSILILIGEEFDSFIKVKESAEKRTIEIIHLKTEEDVKKFWK